MPSLATFKRVVTGVSGTGGRTQLYSSTETVRRGLQLKADPANASKVWVGFAVTVTPGTTAATDGFPLSAGDTLFVSPEMITGDGSNVYVVSDGATQSVNVINC